MADFDDHYTMRVPTYLQLNVYQHCLEYILLYAVKVERGAKLGYRMIPSEIWLICFVKESGYS